LWAATTNTVFPASGMQVCRKIPGLNLDSRLHIENQSGF
jgi:hypothetical protein